MGFFDFFKTPDINEGVTRFQSTPGAVLLDVRTRSEYAQGHIPRSRNLPLQEIQKVSSALPRQNTPLFVYCLSGARSRQAVSQLQKMGYTDVTNLGGISGYRGKVVSGK